MSEQVSAEQADFEKYFTVFAGSAEEDVSYAKTFWSASALHPPLESRLVSADVRQRLRVAGNGSPHDGVNIAHRPPSIDLKSEVFLHEAYLKQRAESKRRYLEKAKKRDEIIALLLKQREDRIKKEMLSLPYRPRKDDGAPRIRKQ
ncbi:cilia- and flagella-associated protein HOATZ isoform X2 [Amia ocellicauda]|uniref:cilia- and flagella-associated protein HOATZ isoform X2 n=1 Tax=Amia ocellicauda TaxID=2972642 RepID=UPI003464A003